MFLDTYSTYYRTGEYERNHRHDLTSVYFAVPNRFFEEYGKLQRIKAEWYEYETTPICITSNDTVYNMLYPYLGKYTYESEDHALQLYTGYQQMVGGSGHYDKYDWAYNCDYTTAINESCKRISYLFSTNGSAIANYVLSAERLQTYVETYDKSFTDGYINVPGKNTSHDLFEKTLSADRTAVSYVGDDIHHKLVDFDADNTFDMLSYDETHSGWFKFFAGLFGLGPNDVDQSYKGISPIKIVTAEDMAKDNLSSTLLIDGSEEALEDFRKFYDESTKSDKTVVLFRFAQTDYMNLPVMAYDGYKGKNLSGQYGKDTYIVQESVFMNFDMLRNEKYLGIYQNGEEVIDYLYPQIVPNDVFEKVRKIINSNKNGKKSITVNYLLRNKMKCGYCGESLIGECGTSKNGERKFYYKCRGRKALRNGCKQQPLRKDLLENLIIDTIMEELCKPQQIDKIVKYLVKSQDQLQERNTALSILEKEQRQVENSINNLLSAIERGIITNSTSKRLKELETRQEEIERLILIERSKTAIKLSEKDIRAFYETALELEPLMLINYAIKQIKVYNDCIEVELNTPTPKSPDDDNNQGFFFYDNLVKKPTYSANGKFAGFEKIRIKIKI